MPHYIDLAKTALNEFFIDKWWDNYSFERDDIEETDPSFDNFKVHISSLRVKVFSYLNSSVLIGEYVEDSHFDEALESLSKIIISSSNFLPPSFLVQIFLEKYLSVNFIELLKTALNSYLNLFVHSRLRFEVSNKYFVYSTSDGFNNQNKRTHFKDEAYHDLKFFEANLTIAWYDEILKPEASFYQELEEFSEKLLVKDKLGGQEFSILLKEKCDFLKIKWLLRQQHLRKCPIYSIVDNREIEVSVDGSRSNKFYSDWRRYIESHYEISGTWRGEVQKDYDELKRKKYEDLNVLQLHRLIKYHKDVQPDKYKLIELKDELLKRYNKLNVSIPNNKTYSLAIALVYALNNQFSLLLETEDVENESVEKLYKEIEDFQSKTGIKNFFVQYKYLLHLVGKLERVYNERKALEFVSPARKIITKCELIISKYKESVIWSEANYNYAFQLPYEECLVDTENSSLPKIYLFSSFLLPLSREKYIPEFEENSRKVFILKSSIEIFENIETEISQFAKLKTEIQNRDVKSMEIVGIFTAIVTFIAGSLPAFKYIETAYQGFLFMFSLSLSLCFFVFLILSISRGLEKLKANVIYLILFFGLAVAAWIILIFYTEDPHPRVQKVGEVTSYVNLYPLLAQACKTCSNYNSLASA